FVFFMLAFALCLAPSAAYAGPALEIEQGYVQPDGATFQAGQRGDEFFHYVRTTEGLLVQKSPADQTWYYVTSEGFGLALGPRADEAAPANALAPSVLANDTGKMAYPRWAEAPTSPDRGVGEAVTLDTRPRRSRPAQAPETRGRSRRPRPPAADHHRHRVRRRRK
ncbi:MAG: hypothetical protein ACLT98_17220, partial [Eggerthellaceae bacterium]